MTKLLLITWTVAVLLQLIYDCPGGAAAAIAVATNRLETTDRTSTPSKRSLIGFGGFEEAAAWPNEWNQFMSPWNGPNFPTGHWSPHKPVPSQMEVSAAIAAAKQASENVLIAQQQMIAAKENVLQQQKLASDREANAQIAQQKLESAAAIQRSESAAAAQGVILAQQRLAATKAALAHQQKLASVKEAHAAEFLRSSAHAAALEIQRTESEAAKLSHLHRNGAAASLHHVAATKDTAIGPIIHGNNRFPGAALFSLPGWGSPTPAAGGFNPLASPTPPAGFFNPKNAPLLWG